MYICIEGEYWSYNIIFQNYTMNHQYMNQRVCYNKTVGRRLNFSYRCAAEFEAVEVVHCNACLSKALLHVTIIHAIFCSMHCRSCKLLCYIVFQHYNWKFTYCFQKQKPLNSNYTQTGLDHDVTFKATNFGHCKHCYTNDFFGHAILREKLQ